MPVKFTEYQRPDPDTEYEELEPIIIKPGKPIVIIDPNDPPIVPERVVCCTCTGSIICTSEQSAGAYSTYYLGGAAAYVYG